MSTAVKTAGHDLLAAGPDALLERAGRAVASADKVLQAAKSGVRAKVAEAGGIDNAQHVAHGLAWLATHFTPGGKTSQWSLYGLYAVERAAVLGRRRFLGARDWYAEGSAHLTGRQSPDGSWGGSLVDTCFALLFLTRSTARGLRAEGAGHGALPHPAAGG